MAQEKLYKVGTTILIVGEDRSGTHLLSRFIDVPKKNVEGNPRHHRLVRRLASCEICPTPELINKVLDFYNQGWDLDKTHQILWLLDYLEIPFLPIATYRPVEEVVASALKHPTVPRDAKNARPCNFWGEPADTIRERIINRHHAHVARCKGLTTISFHDMVLRPEKVVAQLKELNIPAGVPAGIDKSRAWT